MQALGFAQAFAQALNANSTATKVVNETEHRGWFQFGSGMSTHVANKCGLPIVASVIASLDQPRGFTVIPTGEYVKFTPDHRKSMTAYITIYTVDDKDQRRLVCENLPKRADYSVMVDGNSFVVDVKYGTIWQRA